MSAASRCVKSALISMVFTVFPQYLWDLVSHPNYPHVFHLCLISPPHLNPFVLPSPAGWWSLNAFILFVFWQYLWGLMWTRMSSACCCIIYTCFFCFFNGGGGVECLVAPLKICFSWPAFNKCQLERTYKLMGMDRKTRKSTWINGNQGYKRIKALTIKGYLCECCTCDKETMNTSYASR